MHAIIKIMHDKLLLFLYNWYTIRNSIFNAQNIDASDKPHTVFMEIVYFYAWRVPFRAFSTISFFV